MASSSDPESSTPSVSFIAEDEVAIEDVDTKGNNKQLMKTMSSFSKQFDVNGDGVLDDAEKAMRNMDTSGRGYITNDKVYAMMQDNMEVQRKLFQTRRIMFVLLALTVILAISNLGTSVAAAYLAKDTATDESDQITNAKTGEALSTQLTTDEIEIQRTNSIEADGTRRLCSRSNGDLDCETDSFLSIDERTCRRMIKRCKRGNAVSLGRTWSNGDTTHINLCPFSGTISRRRPSTLKNNLGERFLLERIEGGNCRLGGDALEQPEDEICEESEDCKGELVCTKDVAQKLGCESICKRRRWVQRLMDACVAGCDITTCEVDSA